MTILGPVPDTGFLAGSSDGVKTGRNFEIGGVGSGGGGSRGWRGGRIALSAKGAPSSMAGAGLAAGLVSAADAARGESRRADVGARSREAMRTCVRGVCFFMVLLGSESE